MKLQHIGEAEFSWARIVSIETESDTCKCRREGILRCSEQIGGQSKTCKGTFKEAAQKLALNRGQTEPGETAGYGGRAEEIKKL